MTGPPGERMPTMSKIHQLDPHVADLIAAGEVVDAPRQRGEGTH